jgi:AraC family transcriptional regulator, ethanolamine operon transcriptional activator
MATEHAVGHLLWDQMESGSLEVNSRVLSAPPLRITRTAFSLGVVVAADFAPQTYLFKMIARPETRARWFGNRVDEANLGESLSNLSLITRGPSAFYTLSINECDVGMELRANLRGTKLARDPVSTSRLRSFLDGLFTASPAGDDPIDCAREDIYGTVLPLVTAAMRPNHWIRTSECQARRLVAVRACEAFMREHAHTTVSLYDLSKAAGMAPRRLINAFDAITGCSPMSYLKRIRLNGAHRALQDAAQTRTVAQIATDFAFWHLGHFSADYRTMFGESPSETLAFRG